MGYRYWPIGLKRIQVEVHRTRSGGESATQLMLDVSIQLNSGPFVKSEES